MIIDLDDKVYMLENGELIEVYYINLLERKIYTKDKKEYNLDEHKLFNIIQ